MQQNQLPKVNFKCGFCGYESGLNLRECPECGRFASVTRQVENSERDAAPPVYYKSPPAEKQIYVCGACGYQTPKSLAECPECGKRRFTETIFWEEPNSSERQNRPAAVDKSEIGKILQYFGFAFIFIALLVFFGFGPTGKTYPRSGIIAGTGENLAGALILTAVGIIISLIGSYLKR